MSKTIYLVKRTVYVLDYREYNEADTVPTTPVVVKAFTDVNKASEYVNKLNSILRPYLDKNVRPYTEGCLVLEQVRLIDAKVPYFIGDEDLKYHIESTELEE